MNYAVVRFVDEGDALGVVHMKWVDKPGSCLFPNVKTNEARDRLLRKHATPSADWTRCDIIILHKYKSFSVALRRLRQAEDTSNLESEDDSIPSKRRRLKKNFKYPGEDSDEESDNISHSSFSMQGNRRIPDDPEDIPFPEPSQTINMNQMHGQQYDPEEIPFPEPPIKMNQDCQQFQRNRIEAIPLPKAPRNVEEIKKKNQPLVSNQPLVNGKLLEYLAGVSQRLTTLENQMGIIIQNQERILQMKTQVQVQEETCPENLEVLGSLPLSDDDGFIHLDYKLSEDIHLRRSLVKVLISVGGKDIRTHIYNMLKRIMSDDVAVLYSLYGKTTKKAFLNTHVSKSIFIALQQVYKEEVNEVKMKEAVGDWLTQASCRKTRRMQRLEKNPGEKSRMNFT